MLRSLGKFSPPTPFGTRRRRRRRRLPSPPSVLRMRELAAFSRRSALCGLLMTPFAPPPQAASAIVTPYCVPGVTAERCRGVFWETGKLYKKDTSSAELTPSEYEALLGTLRSQRKSLDELRTLAELGSNAEVGAAVAIIRADIRKTGTTLCRSLEEERYDAEYMLNELIAGLGDLDRLSMNPDSLPPGFTLSLLLKSTLCVPACPHERRPAPCLSRPPPPALRKRFDEFLSGLPARAPTAPAS